jgi:hypothetical protein
VKLWCFLFPDPKSRLASARVAAPDMPGATLLLSAALGEGMPESLLCQFMGHQEVEIGVLRTVPREAA